MEFLKLIQERDRREKLPFEALFETYSKMSRELSAVERERESYKQKAEGLEAKLGAGGDLRTNTEQEAHIRRLEQELRETQVQLTEAYKKNAGNAEQMLDAIAKEKVAAEQAESWSRRAQEAESAAQSLQQALDERELNMNVMKDEVVSVQARLVSTTSELQSLRGENATLIERWMQHKNQEAAKLNAINEEQVALLKAQQQAQNAESLLERGRQALATGKAEGGNMSDMFTGGAFIGDVALPQKAVRSLAAHNGEANSTCWNMSGSRFCSGGSDKYIKVWDSVSGSAVATLSGSGASLMKVAWSNNEEYIVGASYDHSATVWSVKTGRQAFRLTGHIGKCYTAAFAPDSRLVVTGAHDRTLKVWDLGANGNVLKTIFCFSSCNDLAIASEYSVIASAHLDGALRVWDQKSGSLNQEILNAHSKQITSVTVDPMTASSLLTSARDNTLAVWDLRSSESIMQFRDEGYRSGLNWARACYSPDGTYIAAGGAEGSLFVWDARTAKLLKQLTSTGGATISSVSWNPNGQQLVSSDRKGRCTVWGR